MKNIDRIKQMTSEELVKFMKINICEYCIYDDAICGQERCSEGRVAWLESEEELNLNYIIKSFLNNCKTDECDFYPNDCTVCKFQYIVDNFNIIDGKITKRQK